jgi:hypothetical protein
VKSRAIRARFDFLFTKDNAKAATEGVPAADVSNSEVTRAATQQPQSKDEEQDKAA